MGSATRLGLAAIAAMAVSAAAMADEGFNPFREPETSRPPPRKQVEPAQPQKPLLAPMEGRVPTTTPWSAQDGVPPAPADYQPYGTPYPAPAAGGAYGPAAPQSPPTAGPLGPQDLKIERTELAPVTAGAGSDLPYELWQGLTLNEIEALFASLEIPPRSPTLHKLWLKLVTAEAGTSGDVRFLALRAEALDRSGLPEQARDILSRRPATGDPVLDLVDARTGLAAGDTEKGCALARGLAGSTGDMPQRLKAEAIVLAGYCAAMSGNLPGAGIAAELAREKGIPNEEGPSVLDALAAGTKTELPSKVTLLTYRAMGTLPPAELAAAIPRASPGLLRHLALSRDADAGVRIAAAEAAAARSLISPADLAEAYRNDRSASAGGAELSELEASTGDAGPRRAALFRAIEDERTPQKKTRQIRAFLDSARRAGFYWPALQIMADPARGVGVVPEVVWFAETGIEIALAAGDYESAREWARLASSTAAGQGDLNHWLALADIADPNFAGQRGADLDSVERLALGGRFDPALLHRLATVLDALGTNIPIPLWDAASRTPQPSDGHLPDTGVLTALQVASKKKEFGHTVLLAMRTLGPAGAEGAHMIALGDSIRALKRCGLEAEARALGLEALFASWPRSAGY